MEADRDENLLREVDKGIYKLRSVYEKNGLLYVKFETKFGLHKGTYKTKLLNLDPATQKPRYILEIEQAVKNLFDIERQNKKYTTSESDKINEIYEIE